MKKIFYTLAILLTLTCVPYASACPQSGESMTGAACSIADLKNLENSQTLMEEVTPNPKREKDLRPISKVQASERQGIISQECILGLCLSKTLLGR